MSHLKSFLKKTTVQTVAMVLVCAMLVVGSAVSFAWLASYLASGDVGFRAGELDDLTLEIARVVHDEDDEAAEDTRSYTTIDGHRIEKNEDGTTHLSVTLANMTFGSIDNVAQLKPENIVYLRLTVPKANGNTVDLRMHYLTNEFITLYQPTFDEDGNVTGTKEVEDVEDGLTAAERMESLYDVETAEHAGDSYLSYAVLVSNEAIAAGELSSLDFDTAESNAFSALTETEVADGTYETLTIVNGAYDEAGDFYYVYIRVVPNLSVFAYSIEYISDIMPCNMFFRIGASFETYYSEPTTVEGGDSQ
ncbi:MAG: hypothetical protein IJW83_04480 [Clostridia bacterium]|nr:hypothetical protein [Clostridia bacterium]